jgi:hypothetical protein
MKMSKRERFIRLGLASSLRRVIAFLIPLLEAHDHSPHCTFHYDSEAPELCEGHSILAELNAALDEVNKR